jgi:hypothetical protein
MRFFIYAIIYCFLAFQESWATPKDAVNLANIVLETISQKSFLNRPNELLCLPPSVSTPFQNKSELINYMCKTAVYLSDEDLKDELTKRDALKAISPYSIDQFIKSFRSFHEFNSTIPEAFNKSTPFDWKLGDQNMTEYPCEYRVKKDSEINFQEMDFKNLAFIGSSHFSKKDETQLPQAHLDLQNKLNSVKPEVLLIEGKDIGKPIECGAVLDDALSTEIQLNSEMRASIKYGFWNQIPLIPADNQEIDDRDLAFFNGDKFAMEEAKKVFTFLSTLHLYHDNLDKKDALALENALQKSNNTMDKESFLTYYKEMNGRDLPSVASDIKQDFSPSIVANPARESNKMADFQNEIRNQSLIKAIQISSSKYKRPAVIYGSGHLGQIGKTLESYLGKPTNVDFDSVCK